MNKLCVDNQVSIEFYSSNFYGKDLQSDQVKCQGTSAHGLYKLLGFFGEGDDVVCETFPIYQNPKNHKLHFPSSLTWEYSSSFYLTISRLMDIT